MDRDVKSMFTNLANLIQTISKTTQKTQANFINHRIYSPYQKDNFRKRSFMKDILPWPGISLGSLWFFQMNVGLLSTGLVWFMRVS